MILLLLVACQLFGLWLRSMPLMQMFETIIVTYVIMIGITIAIMSVTRSAVTLFQTMFGGIVNILVTIAIVSICAVGVLLVLYVILSYRVATNAYRAMVRSARIPRPVAILLSILIFL